LTVVADGVGTEHSGVLGRTARSSATARARASLHGRASRGSWEDRHEVVDPDYTVRLIPGEPTQDVVTEAD
jgi:hypothetical protein